MSKALFEGLQPRILLGTQRQGEVYRRPENVQYQEKSVAGMNDRLECSNLPGLGLQVGEMFTWLLAPHLGPTAESSFPFSSVPLSIKLDLCLNPDIWVREQRVYSDRRCA